MLTTNSLKRPLKRLSKSLATSSADTSRDTSRMSKTVNVDGERSVLQCLACGAVCSNQSGFSRHKCKSKKKDAIVSASESIGIEKNKSTITTDAIFQCDICNQVCKSLVGLKRHKASKHNAPSQSQRVTRSQK